MKKNTILMIALLASCSLLFIGCTPCSSASTGGTPVSANGCAGGNAGDTICGNGDQDMTCQAGSTNGPDGKVICSCVLDK